MSIDFFSLLDATQHCDHLFNASLKGLLLFTLTAFHPWQCSAHNQQYEMHLGTYLHLCTWCFMHIQYFNHPNKTPCHINSTLHNYLPQVNIVLSPVEKISICNCPLFNNRNIEGKFNLDDNINVFF